MSEKRATYSTAEQTSQEEVEAMMVKMLRDLCSISQAAEVLGVDVSHTRRLAESGRIAARKLEKTWVVYVPSLVKYRMTKSKRGRPPSGKPKHPPD
jgi:excisionase family DNA binding protein